jgi:hypothetical protein
MGEKMLNLPSEDYCAANGWTVGDVAERLYPGITYDTARPISWDKIVRDRGIEPNGRYVWLYPKNGTIRGFPAPLTQEAALDLGKLALGLRS